MYLCAVDAPIAARALDRRLGHIAPPLTSDATSTAHTHRMPPPA
jgi:hypothetical protein